MKNSTFIYATFATVSLYLVFLFILHARGDAQWRDHLAHESVVNLTTSIR